VAAWYAALFVVSSAAVGVLGYRLLETSLVSRDHDLLRVKLSEYAARYESGGLRALSGVVEAEQASGDPDSVMVRLIAPSADVLLLSPSPLWRNYDLSPLDRAGTDVPRKAVSPTRDTTIEVISRVLWDGTIMQVGRTTVGREQVLGEVRKILGVMLIALVSAALAGGIVVTRQALKPVRDLLDTVTTIAATGQLSARVTTEPHGDMVDELGRVFNTMLARIETLVGGMRGALDNVAHDLRTPVARLRARAEAALASDGTREQALEALANCVEEADRVTALLTTLLDISEAETGTMRLSIEAVDVAAVARETLDLYEDIAEDRGVSLATSVPEHVAAQADRQRLRQVLANLVDNGIKYTPSGGRVDIHASTTGERVTISVTDTGIGIAEGDIGRIWERLYRADQSRGEAGLGLGLSLVSAIVSAHSGEVGVDSEPGRGSVFRITLPAGGPAAGSTGPAASAAGSTRPAASAAGSTKYEVQSTKYGGGQDI
jgi:signal transduction histidine kinase